MNEYAGFRLGDGGHAAVPRVRLEDVTPERFFAEFVLARRPCVLGGHPAPAARGDRGRPDAGPPSAKRARSDGPASSNAVARWDWPDELLRRVAGDAEVEVEVAPEAKEEGGGETDGRAATSRRFGHGRKERVRFGDVIDHVSRGDESIYLTTQRVPEDDSGRPRLCGAPAAQLLLGGHAPLTIDLMGGLVLAQVNVWMGASKAGASSGLHHDFHDNVYVLVRGAKRFQLWSPDSAFDMATAGTIARVHPNGRIVYRGEEHIAADGSWPDRGDASSDDEDNDNDGDGPALDGDAVLEAADDEDAALEAALAAALDGDEIADDYDDDADDADGEGDAGGAAADDGANAVPKSFSTIDPSSVDDASGDSRTERFRAAASVTVSLSAGDSLYLPAGWFHDVTSLDGDGDGDGDGAPRGHLAFNYWYHSPVIPGGTIASPYGASDFWQREWRQMREHDPVVRELSGSG